MTIFVWQLWEPSELQTVYGGIAAGPHQQSFLVPSPMGLMTIFYCVTALGAFRTPDGVRRNCCWPPPAVILRSESWGTHGHVLLSDSSRSLQNPISTLYRHRPMLCSFGIAPDGSSVVAYVFVAMETSLPCRCIATVISSCSTSPAFSHHVTVLWCFTTPIFWPIPVWLLLLVWMKDKMKGCHFSNAPGVPVPLKTGFGLHIMIFRDVSNNCASADRCWRIIF
jgi:hypothetical protein